MKHGRVWAALKDRQPLLGPAPEAPERWSHWRLSRDGEGIAWLVLDKADSRANTLSEDVLRELDAALEVLEKDWPDMLVIRSAKLGNFCVGADINEFTGLDSAEVAEEKIHAAHGVANRLDGLPCTTVAVLHGTCVGGGLELALACDVRIALPGARLGFPEIMLGLHPGLGGTARSTALIDPTEAMKLMLTGKSVSAKTARRLGLVDAITEERHLANALADVRAGTLRRHRPGWRARLLNSAPGRRVAAYQMRKQTERRAARDHYPAPYALIELWEAKGGDERAMLEGEIRSFARLLETDTARNLIRVFFLREQMKKLGKGEADIARVHVVGAGEMGADIAAWCALQGLRVTLSDIKLEMLGKAVARANRLFRRRTDRSIDARDAMDRLMPDPAGEGVTGADLVIEAVPENIDLKRKVYSGLEARMKEGAILATNTSSIRLEDLAEGLDRPERLVGLHFFNPVHKMQLVEVVTHPRLDDRTRERAQALVTAIDRLPVPVSSAPGFLVNRALTPYLLEAMVLLSEGPSKETIDRAAERFGMPVGPIELADRVGLDICLSVADMLQDELDQPMPDLPDDLRRLVDAGSLGEKTGRGLYEWKDGKPQKDGSGTVPSGEMIDRLILPMLNACVACLRENVVADEDSLDGAMIFGTGFAPFRGGPMHYARSRGITEIRETLEALERTHGARFRPDPGWAELG